MRLKDKVSIITGAGSGIGEASAFKFAREGAKVVAVDIQQAANEGTVSRICAEGGTAIAVHADVSKAQDVSRMIRAAVETYGRLDVLYNNAGITVRGTLLEIDEAGFDRVFATNVKGVFLASKEALPIMISQGGGVILTTSSTAAITASEGSAVYPATKGAVVQLMRAVAIDHGPDGIRANCICPGPVDTPLNRWSREQTGDPEGVMEYRIQTSPLRRISSSEEMANVAAFLCSDEASYITGAAIMADGGWTAR